MRFAILFAAMLSMQLTAADPVPKPPDQPIRFPDIVVPPSPPSPAPNPAAPIPVNGDEVYAFDADIETMVKAYPASVLKVDVQPGPARIKAKWAGGDGKSTWKTFTGKYVTTVEASGNGAATLVVVPVGAKTVGEWIEKSIAANVGPQPPPGPSPPGPKPPEPPPGPVTSFRVIFVYESADILTPVEKGIIFGKAVEEYLNAACTDGKAGWRRRDKDASGETDPTMKAVWSQIRAEFAPPKSTKTPAVAIQVNDKIEILPLEKTVAEQVAVLKKYREGK